MRVGRPGATVGRGDVRRERGVEPDGGRVRRSARSSADRRRRRRGGVRFFAGIDERKSPAGGNERRRASRGGRRPKRNRPSSSSSSSSSSSPLRFASSSPPPRTSRLAAATERCRFGRRVQYAPRVTRGPSRTRRAPDACDGKNRRRSPGREDVASLVAAPAELAATDDGSSRRPRSGGGAPSPGVVAVAAALGVASAAGALACFERRRRNKRSAPAASARRPPSSSSDGGMGGGRRRASDDESDRARLVGADALGSARRFYRHLEAGSAGDLPLVEDLDKREKETASARADVVAPLGAFFQPAERRRSHSISGPATSARPPLARPRSAKAPRSSSGGSSRVGDDEEARQE